MLDSMAGGHRIALHVDAPFMRHVRRRPLSALARRVLAGEDVPQPGEVSIVITDDGRVRALNWRFRHVDAPTDVLSFGLDAGEGFPLPPGRVPLLGEIVISYPTAARQAAEAGQSVENELAHLLVHGVLHLLDYDHETPQEARAMRAREEALLGFALRHPKGRAAH